MALANAEDAEVASAVKILAHHADAKKAPAAQARRLRKRLTGLIANGDFFISLFNRVAA